jgi:hypothetical protein
MSVSYCFHSLGIHLHMFCVLLEFFLKGIHVIERNMRKSGHVWAESIVGSGVIRTGDCGKSSAPKVLVGKKDSCFILGNAFDIVSPSSSQLDGGFASLDTCIHWKDSVHTKILRDIFAVFTEDVVVKGSRRQGQFLCLLTERIDDLRVAVALVDRTILTKRR